MIDTIINIENKLEKLNGRNLDDMNGIEYLVSLDHTTLISDKFSCKPYFDKISFDDIRNYLATFE